MESNTLRLGVACLVALATSPGAASAAVEDTIASIEADCRPARYCDALIEFLMATGGVISADTAGAGLDAAFESVTGRVAREFPRFLRDLVSLGVTPDVRDVVECGIVEKLCNSSLSEATKVQALRALADVPGGVACVVVSGGDEQLSARAAEVSGCVAVHVAYQT